MPAERPPCPRSEPGSPATTASGIRQTGYVVARTVLVVDDEPSIVDAISTALGYEGFEVSQAFSGREALAAVARTMPDLVILDVMLPDVDGLEVCRRLRSDGYDMPIMFLSSRSVVEDRVAGLKSGADDYVTKPFSLVEVVARAHTMLRRRGQVTSPIEALRFADVVLDEATHEVWRAGQAVRMTATEFRLLAYFMANPRLVLSKAQILTAVWHYDFDGDPNIVETYVRYLRRKLDEHGPPLIETIRLVGYRLRDPS